MKLIQKKETSQPALGAQPRLPGLCPAAEQETNREIIKVTWFHEDGLLLQPTSELEFDLELLGRHSRAPKFSPWGFRFPQAWGSALLPWEGVT